MHIIPHYKVDTTRWDALVYANESGPYDYSWYLSAISENWYIYVNDDYSKGFAFSTSKRLGIENVTVAPFVREHQFLGEWSLTEVESALSTLKQQFKGGIFQTNFAINNHQRSYQLVRQLRLEKHAERNINKALKNDITVVESQDIATAFQILAGELGEKIPGFDHEKQQLLFQLFSTLQDYNKLIIKEIRYQDKVIGGLFFFKGKERDVYIKGGSNEMGKKLGGMYLAMHQQIQETLTKGKLFDFDGSEVPGVKRFNQYFGTEDHYYYQISWNKNPFWYNIIRKIYLKLKK